MKYVKLGKTGLTVSRLCLGCLSYGSKQWQEWVLTEPEAREHFARAFELGINFFDTADVYSLGESERITGRYLREMGRRDEIVIATKVNGRMGTGPNLGGLSRKHVIDGCEASLRRLGTDYIDLYQIHRYDPTTPLEETLEALDSLVRAGKVRYLGASSMATWQFAKALHTAREFGWHRFVTMQNQYSLIYREEENDTIPLCVERGVGVIPWSPLARGFLTGNRSARGEALTTRATTDPLQMTYRESDYAVLGAVESVARARGVNPAQIALAWVLQAPGVTAPIVGSTKVNHLGDAATALEIELDAQEIAALEAHYRPRPATAFLRPSASQILKGEFPPPRI